MISSLMERDMATEREMLDAANAEVMQLSRKLRRVEYELAQARFENRVLRDNMNRGMTVPMGDRDWGYECDGPYCNTPLAEDYSFCPGCGRAIDWGHWRDTTEPDIDQWRDR